MLPSARWIWFGDPGFDIVNSWMQARHVFTLKRVPRSAKVEVTADSRYRLFVNGKPVCRGPARGFQQSWPVDTVDIAPFLSRGRNVLAAIVHNYGIGTFQYISQGYAGFLLSGQIGNADISTGERWKIRPAPGYIRFSTRASLQMGFQEFFDARRDDDAWLTAGYDDSAWMVTPGRVVGSMPWHSLEPRDIPLLREDIVQPSAVVLATEGRCARDYRSATDVVRLYTSEQHRWTRKVTALRSKNGWAMFDLPASGRGRFRAVCIDFGTEVTGSVALSVDGAKGHEILDTIATEGLMQGTPAIFPPDPPCYVAVGNRLVPAPRHCVHEPFEFWGFRYIVLVVRNSVSPLRIGVRLRSVRYPLDVRARFETSDSTLNAIHQISVRTQECCMFDAYVDCPWREQAQWWGDARVQAANTFYLSADARLLARGIRQLAAQEVPNGLTYGHAPTVSHHCILPDFTLVWLLTHRDYYWQTGDLTLFASMKDRVLRALQYFADMTDHTGLVPSDARYWLFLDWCNLFKDGYSTLYNLLYLMALRSTADLFDRAGDDEAALVCGGRARKLEAAIGAHLIDRKVGFLHGGLTREGKPIRQPSAHIAAFAILLELFPGRADQMIRELILPVKDQPPGPLTPTPFFSYYIFQAMKKCGYGPVVIDWIAKWWGGMVDRGLTTTEETWNAQPGGISLCHAWSAHPVVHFANVMLGVWQESPGWKRIRFAPDFARGQFARGIVASPLGDIESAWAKSPKEITVTLKLPKGMSAVIDLPGISPVTIRDPRQHIWRIDSAEAMLDSSVDSGRPIFPTKKRKPSP